MIALTDKALRRMFRRLNRLWFNDRVPEPDVIRFAKLDDDDGNLSSSDGQVTLQINRDFARHPGAAEIVMLHEMVHALMPECKVEHGCRYGAEIVRLWAIGAYEGLL